MMHFPPLLLGLGLLAATSLTQAAPITVNGDRFSVTYDDAQTGLYGPGYLSGSLDTFYFQPTAFTTFSGGSPVDTSASLQFTLMIEAGYHLGGLEFSEWGNYFLSNAGMTNVAASVQVLDIDTLAISTLALAPRSSLDQSGGSIDWALFGLIAPPSAGSQILQVTLDNELTSAPVGGIGFIQQAYTGFKVLTVADPAVPVPFPVSVPEPSSWALLLVGALAAGLTGGRRVTRSGTRPYRA